MRITDLVSGIYQSSRTIAVVVEQAVLERRVYARLLRMMEHEVKNVVGERAVHVVASVDVCRINRPPAIDKATGLVRWSATFN